MQILKLSSDEKKGPSVFSVIINQQSTIGREIQRHFEFQPDHPAVVSSNFSPLSYRELQYQIEEISAGLRLAGFDRNARIVVALPSGPRAALAIVAVACSAVAVPLNPKLTLAEIESCLAVLRPDAILLLRDDNSVARRVAEREGLTTIEAIPAKEDKLGFEIVVPHIRAAAQPDEPNEPDPDAVAFIHQTSATASEPKLIPFSHRNMLAAAARFQAWFKLTPQDRCLSVIPVHYGHGLKQTVFTPLLTGGTVAFPANASEFDYSEWFVTLKPTWFTGGPTLHHLIFDQTKTKANAKTIHSLRFILTGGASFQQDIHQGLQHALGVPVLEYYGSSEFAWASANLPPPGPCKLGTCGIPWPDTVIIVGEDGRRVAIGEQGEVLVRGPTVTSGYLDAPELNRASFVDGCLKTGDIGSLDEEGFLILHGRQKDLINRGGEKVWPIEIDDALMRHPAIAEAAAFPMPHPRLGEDVAAAVVLRPGEAATPVELRRYLGQQLASFKVPRRIIILNQLPKGVTGKVLRRRLSEFLGTSIAVSPAAPDTSVNSSLLFRLRELWERLLNSGPLTIDDDFFEKGGDSLLAVEMLCEVERFTGQIVPTSILFEATTIRQLAQELSKGENLQPKPLIHMSANGSQAPLIFFHGDINGPGYYATRLARLMGPDQPLIVIAPHGIGGERIPRSIEAMAADRLPLILNAQPQGPYRLAGWCIGGLVAFETARLLIAAEKEVEMVAMIDSPTVNARRSVQTILSILGRARPIGDPHVERAMAWIWSHIASFDNQSLPRRWSRVRTAARRVVTGQVRTTLRTNGPEESYASQNVNERDRNLKYASAMSNYFPGPLAVQVIYFSAEYNAKAWLQISSNIEVIKLAGDHGSMTIDPTDLVHHLRVRLPRKSKANPQPSS